MPTTASSEPSAVALFALTALLLPSWPAAPETWSAPPAVTQGRLGAPERMWSFPEPEGELRVRFRIAPRDLTSAVVERHDADGNLVATREVVVPMVPSGVRVARYAGRLVVAFLGAPDGYLLLLDEESLRRVALVAVGWVAPSPSGRFVAATGGEDEAAGSPGRGSVLLLDLGRRSPPAAEAAGRGGWEVLRGLVVPGHPARTHLDDGALAPLASPPGSCGLFWSASRDEILLVERSQRGLILRVVELGAGEVREKVGRVAWEELLPREVLSALPRDRQGAPAVTLVGAGLGRRAIRLDLERPGAGGRSVARLVRSRVLHPVGR